MSLTFQDATKEKAKARVAIEAPSGAGKTYTSLAIATALGGVVGVIDTEHGTASKFAGPYKFKTLNLPPPFTPERYTAAIEAASKAGVTVLIIDSLSHEWDGPGGMLEMVDKATHDKYRGNKWQAWAEFSPRHRALIETVLRADLHIIATMRSKMDTDLREVNGRKEVVKLGMKAIQREGFEYEYDVIVSLDLDHNLRVTKSRCPALDGYVELRPDGTKFAEILGAWLSDGATPAPQAGIPPEIIARIDAVRAYCDGDAKRKAVLDSVAKETVRGEWGFNHWQDFYKRGTVEQAAFVLTLLPQPEQQPLLKRGAE